MPECDSVFVSSGAFRSRSIQEIVGMALQAGLHCLEMGSGTDWTPTLLEPIRQTSGNPIRYLLHNYFPPHESPFVLNLAASDPEILSRSLAHCRAALDLSVRLSASFFSVHAGFTFSARPEQLGQNLTAAPKVPLAAAHDTFVESLRELCAYGGARGVKVLVENNVIAPFNLVDGKNTIALCATADEALRTLADVDSPDLGLLIDVGHLKVTANALRFDPHAYLDAVAAHVAAFHLSDNDGMSDQNLPFGDGAWFVPRLADFPSAMMVVEAYRLDACQIWACCDVVERARSR